MFPKWTDGGQHDGPSAPYRAFLEDAAVQMGIVPRDRILDAGCGEGWAARLFSRGVPEGLVVGLDTADEMIQQARLRSVEYENLMFVLGEAEDVPWQSDYFSKVVCVESFHHFQNPAKALEEFRRVLIPGASVWIFNPISIESSPSLSLMVDGKTSLQPSGANEYRELLEGCGFVDFTHRMVPQRISFPGTVEKQLPSDLNERGAWLITATKPQ